MDHSWLFYLPHLVVRKLMQYLDTRSMVNLRLVCKTTKSWIATCSTLLDNFKVPLESNKDVENLLETAFGEQENWKKFIFLSQFGNFEFENCLHLVARYESTIKSLEFKELVWSEKRNLGTFELISLCKNLKALRITTLTLENSIGNENWKNFPQITHLSITTVNFVLESQLQIFFTKCFAKYFSHLEFISIPRPLTTSSDTTWIQLKEIQWTCIIHPIMSSFKNQIKTVDVTNVFASNFGALAEICVELEIFLINVNDKQVKYVFLNTEDFLEKILSIREKIDDRRPLSKWKNLESMYIRTSRCDIRNYYDFENDRESHEAIVFPKLKTLHIVFDSCARNDPGFLSLNRIILLLIQTVRPTVEKLILQWPEFGHDTPTSVITVGDIIKHFPRLRKLKVIGWELCTNDKKVLQNNLQFLNEFNILNINGIVGNN